MFYVGVHVHYNGANQARQAHVRKMEKLGHSVGRGERFLKDHPVKEVGDLRYRAMVLQLPNGFILRNDVIQNTMRIYQCDWQTAKFHCYRLSAQNVLGKQDVWADVLTAAQEAEEKLKTTETEPQPILEANVPVVNPEMDTIKP